MTHAILIFGILKAMFSLALFAAFIWLAKKYP